MGRGLRQGDPLSLFHFMTFVEGISIMQREVMDIAFFMLLKWVTTDLVFLTINFPTIH